MHLQVRIVAAMLLLALLAIGTGTVLLLGYLFAAFSIGVIIFIKGRKMIKRIADARLARLASCEVVAGGIRTLSPRLGSKMPLASRPPPHALFDSPVR